MADADRNENASVWGRRARAATAALLRPDVLRAVAGVVILTAGVAAASGASWAIVAARQTMHGRMAQFVRSAPHTPAGLTTPIQVADNTP